MKITNPFIKWLSSLYMYYWISSLFKWMIRNKSLVIAIVALFYAIKSNRDANEQFRVNLESSQKQLIITNELLNISLRSLQEQLYKGKPTIIIDDIKITETRNVREGILSPKIITGLVNIGGRSAIDLSLRPFVVYGDNYTIRPSIDKHKKTVEPNPESVATYNFLPQILDEFTENFYYVFEIEYYDILLDTLFRDLHVSHYTEMRGKLNFYTCPEEKEVVLITKINEHLQSTNERLLEY